MRKKLDYIEIISKKIILYISIIMLALIIFTGLFWERGLIKLSILIFIGTILFYYIFKLLVGKVRSNNKLIYLIFIALAIRLIWIFSYNVKPVGDYEMFYNFAVYLKSTGFGMGTEKWKYIALFKHIFGYSSFLAILFSIFGTSVLVGQLANVFLSIISLILIYKIALNIIGEKGAFIAGVLWTFYPSQIVYNIFLLSEPLWVTILLGIFYMMIKLNDTLNNELYKKSMIYFVVISLLCVWMNSIRPISMIIIIMLFIWMFVLNISKIKSVKDFSSKLLGIVLVILIFITGSNITNKLIEYKILLKPASSYGWSIYVGLNEEYGGSWNGGDSKLFSKYSENDEYTAQEAQDIMMEYAKDKIKNGNINFETLIMHKIQNLWGDDSTALAYLPEDYLFYGLDGTYIFSVISYIYYFSTVIFSILAIIKILREKYNKFIILFPLYFLGITFAQLLIEVAQRYHYSGIISLILLSAYFVSEKVEDNI